jgi:hypothetical protein
MKKATDITFGAAIIIALFAISVLYTGVFANNELIVKSSLNMFLTCEALCVLGFVFKLIEKRR